MENLVWKMRISVLWIFLAVSMSAAMILYIMGPGVINDIIAGEMEEMEISAGVLMLFALFWLIPLIMAFLTLVLKDIASTADLFFPVYSATEGLDGYVSLEVSPLLAADTEGTIAEARRLFAALQRPNVMIKVPATPAGIPAIRRSLAGAKAYSSSKLPSVPHRRSYKSSSLMRGLANSLRTPA